MEDSDTQMCSQLFGSAGSAGNATPVKRSPIPQARDDSDEIVQLRADMEEQNKRLEQLEGQLKAAMGCRNFSKGREPRPSELQLSNASSNSEQAVLPGDPSPFSRNLSRNSRDLEAAEPEDSKANSEPSLRNRSGDSHLATSGLGLGRPRLGSSRGSTPPPSTPPRSARSPKDSTGEQQPLVATGNSGRLSTKRPKKSFDKDLLNAIYDKPYRQARRQGAMAGAGIVGLMSMPFGPIGMVAGGIFGSFVGGSIGLWLDRRTLRKTLAETEAEKRRLKSLVRWAVESFHEDDEFVDLIEMVTLEFKPIADIANGSKHARKLLKLLDGWIANKKVTRHLWVYMDSLLKRWRDLKRDDFMKSMQVFQTLTTMYRHSTRLLDAQEIEFLHRMERLLEHESVKLVIKHAEQDPSQNAARLMESMIYVDSLGNAAKKRSVGNSPAIASPAAKKRASDEASDESDAGEDAPEYYHYTSTAKGGIMMAPSDKDIKSAHSSQSISRQTSSSRSITNAAAPGPEGVEDKVVLKTPFFKGWDDFLEFDSTFKHKMPITLSEFELLSQKNTESLKGWEVPVERKEIRVAKTLVGNGLVTVRAWGTVPGVDMAVAFYQFFNNKMRMKWDKVFAKMELVGAQYQGSDIVYSLMKVPPVTPRDFVQWRRCRVLEDGTIHIVLRSAEHPDVPEVKGVIRAESHISGYILKQEYDDAGVPILKIFIMTCVDVKGLIPKWIINAAAPRKPAEWVESLRKAAIDYQNENPNYKEDLAKELDRYRGLLPYDYEPAVVSTESIAEPIDEKASPVSKMALQTDAVGSDGALEAHGNNAAIV